MLGGWLVRLLIAALIIRAIWSLLTRLTAGAPGPTQVRKPRSVPLVGCRVCRTYVQQSRALQDDDGETHYFCSEDCRRKFAGRA